MAKKMAAFLSSFLFLDSDWQGSKEGHTESINAVGIALGVIFSLLFIVALLVGVWFYRRKHGNHCKSPFPRNCFRKT